MTVPYEKLIKQARIRIYHATPREVQQLLQVSARDLNAGRKNLDVSPDWAYTMAYNAALQACRALVLHEGYRPRGADQHATVVAFIEESLGPEYSNQVHLLDQMRRKRHRVIYEVSGLIGKEEAEQAIAFAQEFQGIINEIITGQLRLKSHG
jgi:uncharacterized protein (UPF0332 family)